MKLNDDTFHFEFTLDELNWLTGAFGIASLPLPDHVQQETAPAQLIEGQKRGHASLLRRGLIQSSPGFGWQVDRLPAAFVQWMATATSMLRVERIDKEGGKLAIHIFTSGEQALSVEAAEHVVIFVLYKSHTVLKKSLTRWLNLPSKIEKTKGNYTIPQPQTLFGAAWQNPALVEKMLTVAGTRSQVQKEAEWVKSITAISILSKIRLHQTDHSPNSYLFLCRDKTALWVGAGTDADEPISFETMTLKGLDAKISAMILSPGEPRDEP